MVSDGHDPRRRDEEWRRSVEEKEARKLKARREKQRTIWFGLGMMGLVGWAVTIPTLIGIALGVWIDKTWPSQYSWTLMLLVAGVAAGCWNAWKWVERESKHD